MNFRLTAVDGIQNALQSHKLRVNIIGDDNSIYTAEIDISGKDLRSATLDQIESWAIAYAKDQFANCKK